MSHEQNPWRLGAPTLVFENPWIRVEDHPGALDPTGAVKQYTLVRFKKLAVGVLPIDADGRVHLVGQWRVPLARYSWEMPEGGAEPGESAEATARRELEEEAGIVAGRLTEVLRMDLSNSITDEQAVCFLALDLQPGVAAPEDVEVLRNRTVPFSEVLAEVVAGSITDSLTVATVLRAHHMASTGAIEPALAALMTGR